MAILARGESYEYEIIQQVRALSGGKLAWTDGMLYPVLHRLERDGLVQSQWNVSETGRKRKYYRLSRLGEQALHAEQEQWAIVHATLSKLWGDTCV